MTCCRFAGRAFSLCVPPVVDAGVPVGCDGRRRGGTPKEKTLEQ